MSETVVSLPRALPGFPGMTTARLFPIVDPDLGDVYAELADAASSLRLLLARPEPFFPGYAADVDDTVTAVVGGDPAAVEVWLVLGHDGAGFTANLRAPVLLNRATATAVQAVLDTDAPVGARLG